MAKRRGLVTSGTLVEKGKLAVDTEKQQRERPKENQEKIVTQKTEDCFKIELC